MRNKNNKKQLTDWITFEHLCKFMQTFSYEKFRTDYPEIRIKQEKYNSQNHLMYSIFIYQKNNIEKRILTKNGISIKIKLNGGKNYANA